jgi:hypothetical protein
MTTGTPRDRVYLALLANLTHRNDQGLATGAPLPELVEQVDTDEETVRAVLEVLTDAGVLVERVGRGYLSDPEETYPEYYTDPEGPLSKIGAVAPAEDIHEEFDEDTIEEIRQELGFD